MYFGTKSYLKSNHYHTSKHVKKITFNADKVDKRKRKWNMTRLGQLAAWHLSIKSQGSAFEVRNETSKNFHMRAMARLLSTIIRNFIFL